MRSQWEQFAVASKVGAPAGAQGDYPQPQCVASDTSAFQQGLHQNMPARSWTPGRRRSHLLRYSLLDGCFLCSLHRCAM
jgi:hypothetical protein